MGLLSSKTLRQIATGAGTRALYKINEAKELGVKGLENLVVARDEVNKEVKKLQDNYNEALIVGSSVGGGSFANFMFAQMGAEKLGGLNNLLPSQKEEEIQNLRVQFDSLDEKQKAQFEQSPYKATITEAYTKDAQDKIKNGLSQYNNLGQSTTNFLMQGLTGGVQKRIREEKEKIMQTVTTPSLRDIQPTQGVTFYQPALTPIDVINNNNVYDKMLVEEKDPAGQGTGVFNIGTAQTNPYFQTVSNIDAQAQTMIEYGFTGTIADARAYVIQKMNNPKYSHPNLNYLTKATDNAPIINTAYTVFSNALLQEDVSTMNEAITELKKAGRNEEANELQEELDAYLEKQKQAKLQKEQQTTLISEKLKQAEEGTQVVSDRIFPSIEKPKYKSDGPLTYSEWSTLSADAVKEIYGKEGPLSTAGLGESDKAFIDKLNTVLGY